MSTLPDSASVPQVSDQISSPTGATPPGVCSTFTVLVSTSLSTPMMLAYEVTFSSTECAV